MVRKYIIIAYSVFFLVYSVLFDAMASINAGLPVSWKDFFSPISVSTMLWSLLVILVAHYLVFKKYYGTKPRWKLFAAIALLLVFQIFFRYLLEEIIFRAVLGYGNYNDKTTFRFYVVDNIYYASIKIFIGFVFFLLEDTLLNQQRQALLKKEKQDAERSFLQAQMNPHFLFNSLNNIYALAYEQHPQTANAVLKLSEVMRYVTYQNREHTPLQNELEYVQHILDLHQLRCDYKLHYSIDVAEAAAACTVMPLLLIPIVENVLKHGDLADPRIPLEIAAAKKENNLALSVSNKIALHKSPETGGIGLENLRRRLELTYQKEQYTFETRDKDNIFTVMVNLQLT